ncbi:Protoporphyrinogen oxidase [Violaceomyces palustris]|uniref:Protoporphyrinogen oxidase n=1 Tax=Violaceomyces palustris TaxID=1673888 RepID=A0ACD0NMW5_9BASI|nr:Protoporphyrinogen oxidase [Violaceomyces palustris]
MLVVRASRYGAAIRPTCQRWSKSRTVANSAFSTSSRHGQKCIAILGGGISGLSSAYHLSRSLDPSHYRIILVEAQQRLGGWVQSQRIPIPASLSDAGTPAIAKTALIEQGPRSIRPAGYSGMVMLDLLSSLSLLPRLLTVPKTASSAQNRFIYYPSSLAKLPSTLPSLLVALFKLPFIRSLVPSLLKEPWVPSRFARPASESKAEQERLRARERLDDESVDAFVARRFGPSLAANLVSAVIHGIYAGDSRRLSVRSVLPSLWEAERTHGSVLRSVIPPTRNKRYRQATAAEAAEKQKKEQRAMEATRRLDAELVKRMQGTSVYSFPGGLQEIVDALQVELSKSPNVEIRTGAAASSIIAAKGGVQIELKGSAEPIQASRVVSALPSSILAELLGSDELPQLDHNPSVDVGVVNVVISPSSKVQLPVEGFGYLIPRTTPKNEDGILGVVFDSDSLPTQDLADPFKETNAKDVSQQRPIKLTVMMGGAHWASLAKDQLPSESSMRERAIRAISNHLSIPASLLEDPERTTILATLQRDCIPQYLVGHPARMSKLRQALSEHDTLSDRLTLVGASYTGVSLNDCVTYAKEAMDQIIEAELEGGDPVITGLEGFALPEASPAPNSASAIRNGFASSRKGSPAGSGLGSSRAYHSCASNSRSSLGMSYGRRGYSTASTDPKSTEVKRRKSLGEILADSIRSAGPMPVSTYMRTCLLDPAQGYYASANAPVGEDGQPTREVLGSRGDFVTSPEISQVFGELLAIFYIARWQACGSPSRTRMIELGPGKGTLLADMVRTFASFPRMLDTIESIQLVETSDGLMKLQLEALRSTLDKAGKSLVGSDKEVLEKDEIKVEWFPAVDNVPIEPEVWTMLTAHEFFDALPTHIFEKTVQGFREVLVDVKRKKVGQSGVTVLKPGDIAGMRSPPSSATELLSSKGAKAAKAEREEENAATAAARPEFQFVLSPSPTPWSQLLAAPNPRFKALQPGQRVEISSEAWAAARRVGELVAGRAAAPPKGFNQDPEEEERRKREEEERLSRPSVGGAGLIVDYGDDKAFGGSFRAFKNHKIVDPFHEPGNADLTANVDFLHLKSAIASTSAEYHGPMFQSHFLQALGLEPRVEALTKSASSQERSQEIQVAAKRLVDPTGMGAQYKFLGVVAPPSPSLTDQSRTGQNSKGEPVYPFEMSV